MLFLFKNILSLEKCKPVDKAEISAIDITLQNSCSTFSQIFDKMIELS